ncbi:MAG: hypothetical protein K2X27_20755 [Candidatus Obscuribacterales bacterium]|nr:hypothetical protein [Candidatus Obscuribacterales bacterium]
MSPALIVAIVGFVLGIILQISAKPLAEMIAPKKESVSAYFRVIFSMLCFVFLPVAAVVLELVCGIMILVLLVSG